MKFLSLSIEKLRFSRVCSRGEQFREVLKRFSWQPHPSFQSQVFNSQVGRDNEHLRKMPVDRKFRIGSLLFYFLYPEESYDALPFIHLLLESPTK